LWGLIGNVHAAHTEGLHDCVCAPVLL
jgi:hypothetical protein